VDDQYRRQRIRRHQAIGDHVPCPPHHRAAPERAAAQGRAGEQRPEGRFGFVTSPIGGGQPHVSDEAGIITAQWKDAALEFKYLYNPGTPRESERTESWTLSADRQKLFDQEWTRRPDGQEFRYRLVFDRQP